MAMQLATWQLLAGDWRAVQELPAKYRAVTAEDVQRVARTWLVPENRTVVTIVPKRPPAEAPAPQGGDAR
jgi:zinc protease